MLLSTLLLHHPPTASSLGKFADMPVGLYTGTPRISVPIFEIKENTLSVPVSLDYHAGGVKLEENASWVGLAWALNAGGVITRAMRSIPDEGIRRTTIKSDHIRIDHYGQHDKPFESFVITMIPLKLVIEEWEVLVNEKVFLTSADIVRSNKVSFPSKGKNREFGLFKITIMIKGVSNEYYFKRRDDSVVLFRSWLKDIKRVKESEELIKVLDYILSRIDFNKKMRHDFAHTWK